jgi:hypothetical protein
LVKLLVIPLKSLLALALIPILISSTLSGAFTINTSAAAKSSDSKSYSTLRSEAIQSEIEEMITSPSISSNITSQLSSNDSNTQDNLQALQTPVTGYFSGTFHQDIGASAPGSGISGHLDGTMSGPMLLTDDLGPAGAFYTPTGTWQVSFDWLYVNNGVVEGSHSYSGPALVNEVTSAHYIDTLSYNQGSLIFDSASNTFSGFITAADSEPGCCLQIFAPTGPGAWPLSGSNAEGEVTTSWTFTPAGNRPPIAVATADKPEVFSGDTVTLDGTESHDPDSGDSIASYQWTQIDPLGGVIGSSATVQFTAPGVDSPTTFIFGLSVSDTHGAVGATTVDILVKPPLCPEGISDSVTTQQLFCRNPPVAVAESVPDKSVLVGGKINLDGRKSHDPDPGDTVVGFDWKKTKPSDKIVPNTLSNPLSSMPTFDVPNYIPSEFTSLGTAPRLLPLEFSLQVTDNHGLKSTNDATVSLNVVCGASDQAKAEKARNFFLGMINYPGGSLKFPETINNFQYFLSGKGDTQGLTQGVTGNGVAESLPVGWLDNALEFKSAQRKIGGDMARDIFNMLRGMNDGESRQLVKSYAGAKYDIRDSQKIYYWTPVGSIPSDFTTAVGSANVIADVDLTVTKSSSIFGSDRVSGKVVLLLKDNYDFNPNKTFNAPPVGSVTSDEIYQLIKCLGARNFNQDTTYSKVLTSFPTSSIHESLARCGEGPGNCRIQP